MWEGAEGLGGQLSYVQQHSLRICLTFAVEHVIDRLCTILRVSLAVHRVRTGTEFLQIARRRFVYTDICSSKVLGYVQVIKKNIDALTLLEHSLDLY